MILETTVSTCQKVKGIFVIYFVGKIGLREGKPTHNLPHAKENCAYEIRARGRDPLSSSAKLHK